MIHQWKKALLEGAPEFFERDSSTKEPVIDEAKIGELTVANDFLSEKLKPETMAGQRLRRAAMAIPEL
ncbi:MAG: hypothetical protein ACR2RF_15270 [Geminicoccaceae bacterium]